MNEGRALRVCLFTQQFGSPFCEVGSYSLDLARGLTELGLSVTVVSPRATKIPEGNFRHVVATQGRLDSSPGGWVNLGISYRNLLRKGGELDPDQFDVLHFADAREALCLPKGLPPAVGTVQKSTVLEHRGHPLYSSRRQSVSLSRPTSSHFARSLESRSYNRLTRIISGSSCVTRALETGFAVPRRKIHGVDFGVSAPEEMGQPLPLLEGDPSILFVGSNYYSLGLPALVRAVASLSRGPLPHIAVHVAGDDRNREEFLKLLRLVGVGDRFHFHGKLDRRRVRELYPRAEMTCVPSLTGKFGLVYLESMLAGTPVIAGNVEGIREIIKDQHNGLLVDPECPEEVAAAVLDIHEFSDLRLSLVARGRATAARFGLTRMVEETVGVYRKAIRQGCLVSS